MAKDDNNKKMDKAEEEEAAAAAAAPIHGDILQAIFSYVPLVDLLPACHVSKAWNRDVFASLRHFNKVKPWLILHTQRRTSPHVTTSHAYDPRSRVWIEIKHQPPVEHVSALKSSHSQLLYTLSPSKFSFSFDPLHLTWHHVEAPSVWRTDPVVAMVGDKVVVAGGACEFEDDPLAVEMYSLETRTWEACESMPVILKDSAASTWLSVAVTCNKIYVAEKYSGVMCSFDPQSKRWYGPYDLRRDENAFYSVITFANSRLIVVGLTGAAEDVEGVKVWEVKRLEEGPVELEEMGEMPKALLEKLKKGSRRGWNIWIEVTSTSTGMGDSVYIHNMSSNPGELGLVVCEIIKRRDDEYCCEWSSINNFDFLLMNQGNGFPNPILDRLAFTCSYVSMADLRGALLHHNCKFLLK